MESLSRTRSVGGLLVWYGAENYPVLLYCFQGLVQIEILRTIERLAGAPISDLFDWIVGTSTGGIVALGTVYSG